MTARTPFLCRNIDRTQDSPRYKSRDIKRVLSEVGATIPLEEHTRARVLLISRLNDPETDHLGAMLLSTGIDYVRLNIDEIQRKLRVCYDPTGTFGRNMQTLAIDGYNLDSSKIKVAFLRHYDLSEVNFKGNALARKFSYEQWYDFIQSFEMNLKCQWINDPSATLLGNNHIHQLSLAKSIGFRIPATIITNDPKIAIKFYESQKCNVVVKALHHHRVETLGKVYHIYTRRLRGTDLPYLDSLVDAPSIFQAALPKQSDIRVTVVGTKTFGTEIESQSAAFDDEDWHRANHSNLRLTEIKNLPDSLKKSCIKLMNALGLRYGSLDFVKKKDGSFTFLEVNPTGDWMWIEKKTGQSITSAVADLVCDLLRTR